MIPIINTSAELLQHIKKKRIAHKKNTMLHDQTNETSSHHSFHDHKRFTRRRQNSCGRAYQCIPWRLWHIASKQAAPVFSDHQTQAAQSCNYIQISIFTGKKGINMDCWNFMRALMKAAV